MDCRPPETFYACPSPFKWRHLEPEIIINWLRVSDTAERSQVDQPIGHQLHAMVPVLETFESDQQSLELVAYLLAAENSIGPLVSRLRGA